MGGAAPDPEDALPLQVHGRHSEARAPRPYFKAVEWRKPGFQSACGVRQMGPQGEERAPGPKQARAEGSSLGLGCSGKDSRRATERRRAGRRLAPSSLLRRICARSRAGAGTTTSPRRARCPLFGGGGWGQLRVLPGRLSSLLDRRSVGRAQGERQGRARRAPAGVDARVPGGGPAPPSPFRPPGSAKPMDAWALRQRPRRLDSGS